MKDLSKFKKLSNFEILSKDQQGKIEGGYAFNCTFANGGSTVVNASSLGSLYSFIDSWNAGGGAWIAGCES